MQRVQAPISQTKTPSAVRQIVLAAPSVHVPTGRELSRQFPATQDISDGSRYGYSSSHSSSLVQPPLNAMPSRLSEHTRRSRELLQSSLAAPHSFPFCGRSGKSSVKRVDGLTSRKFDES